MCNGRVESRVRVAVTVWRLGEGAGLRLDDICSGSSRVGTCLTNRLTSVRHCRLVADCSIREWPHFCSANSEWE